MHCITTFRIGGGCPGSHDPSEKNWSWSANGGVDAQETGSETCAEQEIVYVEIETFSSCVGGCGATWAEEGASCVGERTFGGWDVAGFAAAHHRL